MRRSGEGAPRVRSCRRIDHLSLACWQDGVAPGGRRRGGCPRETRVHDTDTRCKRRDGAWVVETCARDKRTHRRWKGGKWRRRFCGRAASLSPHRSAKTVTPRGGAHLRVVDRAEGAQVAPRVRCKVQPRDGWAVGETKKNERTSHGECDSNANRGSAELRRRRNERFRGLGGHRARARIHPP
jgi:hypothetical protein